MFNETENYNWRLDFVLVFQRKDNIYVQVRVNRTQTVNKRKKKQKKKHLQFKFIQFSVKL